MNENDLKCPQCGTIMRFNKDQTEARCGYCNYTQLTQNKERLAYVQEEKRKTNKKIKIFFLLLGSILLALSLFLTIVYFSKELIKDPFENITLKFHGENRNGEVSIEYKEKNDKIEYRISKNKNLVEGEKITVYVNSRKYRFDVYEKEYIVKGLLMQVSSLDELTAEVSEYINNKSYEFQKDKIENGISFKGTILELKPNKFYIGTTKDKSILFDIFTIKIEANNGQKFTKYVVTSYDNAILTGNENTPLKYDDIDNIGGMILAGNEEALDTLDEGYVGYIHGFNDLTDIDKFIESEYDKSMKVIK